MNFQEVCQTALSWLDKATDYSKPAKFDKDSDRRTRSAEPLIQDVCKETGMNIWGIHVRTDPNLEKNWMPVVPHSPGGWCIEREATTCAYRLVNPNDWQYIWWSFFFTDNEANEARVRQFCETLIRIAPLMLPTSPIDAYNLQPHERRQIVVVGENVKYDSANMPRYTVKRALELFHFPPNHPIAGAAYAMVDVLQNDYYPLAVFHDRVKKLKQAAFFNLCASLGAKEIRVQSVTINNKALNMNGNISFMLADAGFDLNIRENNKEGSKIVMTFAEPNKLVKDFESPWLNTEPTWMSMVKARKENNLKTLIAEFNHTDDMGINANLSMKLQKLGINIGGSFTEMKRVKLKYEVVFW